MHADAVIVAAGSSTRFGNEDKLFADLRGRPLLAWSLTAYETASNVDRIVVVVSHENLDRVSALGREWAPAKFSATVAGGMRRRDSVEAGIRAVRSTYVAIHDGARPLTPPALIDACIEAAAGKPGAIVASPVSDTIKAVRDGVITGHPDRSILWAAQTPQVVRREAWLAAAAAGDDDETDDAAMLSRFALDCVVIEGSAENLKITRPFDLDIARLILRAREGL